MTGAVAAGRVSAAAAMMGDGLSTLSMELDEVRKEIGLRAVREYDTTIVKVG